MDLNDEELEATRKMQSTCGRAQGKTIELSMKLREEILKLPKCKMYGIMRCKKEGIILNKEEVISKRMIEVKLAEINEALEDEYEKCKGKGPTRTLDMLTYAKEELEELLEE